MKIRINREIEIPDSLTCSCRGKDCPALERIVEQGKVQNHAHCKNFNDYVFWGNGMGFIKNQACIEAARNHLLGVTR